MKKIIKIQKKEDQNNQQSKLDRNYKKYDSKQDEEFSMQDELLNCSFESDQELKEFSQMYQKYDKQVQQKQQIQLRSQAQKGSQELNDQSKLQQKQKPPKIKPFHLQNKSKNTIQSEKRHQKNSKYSDSFDSDEDQILQKYFNATQNDNFKQMLNYDDSSDFNIREQRNTRSNSQLIYANKNSKNQNYFPSDHKSEINEKSNSFNIKINEKRNLSQILPKKHQTEDDDLSNSEQESKQLENQLDQDNSSNLKLTKKLILKKSIIQQPQQQQHTLTLTPVQQNQMQSEPEKPAKIKTLSNSACSPIKIDSLNKLFEESQFEDIEGSFEKGHQALSMQMHDYQNDQYLVEWKNIQSKQIDSVRIKPKSTVYKLCEIKKNAPEIYLQFLETQFGDFQKYKHDQSLQEKELIQKKQFQDSNNYVIKITHESKDNKQNEEHNPTVMLQQQETKETKSQLGSQQQLEEINPSCFNCDEKLSQKNQHEQEELLFENNQESLKESSELKPLNGEQEYKPQDQLQNKSYSEVLMSQVQELPQDISFEDQESLQKQQSLDIVLPVENQKNDASEIVEEKSLEDKANTQIEQELLGTEKDAANFESKDEKQNDLKDQVSNKSDNQHSKAISIEDGEITQLDNNPSQPIQSEQHQTSQVVANEEMQIEESDEKANELFEVDDNQKSKIRSIEKTSSTEKMMEKLTVSTEELMQTPEKKKSQSKELEIEVKEKKVIQIDLDTYQDDEEEDITQEISDDLDSHIPQVKFQNLNDEKLNAQEVEELKCKEGDDLFEPIVTDHHLHNHQHLHAKEIFENHSTKSKLEIIPEVGNDSESDQSCQNRFLNSSIRSFDKQAQGKKNSSVEMIEDDVGEYTQNNTHTAPLVYPIQSRTIKVNLNQPRVVAARKSTGVQIKQTNFNDSSEEENSYEIEEHYRQQEGANSLLSGALGRFKSRIEKLL
ncbi:hypothetical protein ABPG74_012630 [Tetrahymena malaccensis]